MTTSKHDGARDTFGIDVARGGALVLIGWCVSCCQDPFAAQTHAHAPMGPVLQCLLLPLPSYCPPTLARTRQSCFADLTNPAKPNSCRLAKGCVGVARPRVVSLG
jgi:hypothetical protein